MRGWESAKAGAYMLPGLEKEAVCSFQDQRQTQGQLSGTRARGSAMFGGSRDVKDAFLLTQHPSDGRVGLTMCGRVLALVSHPHPWRAQHRNESNSSGGMMQFNTWLGLVYSDLFLFMF